jgi:hypothetical protein
MSTFNWAKAQNKTKRLQQSVRAYKARQQKYNALVIEQETTAPSEQQMDYVRNILKKMPELCTECDGFISLRTAKRIINEFESKEPATEKLKFIIKKNKLLLESKIDELTIKKAKQVIEQGKRIEKKKQKLIQTKQYYQKLKKSKKRK